MSSHYVFYFMGRSASGKDAILSRLWDMFPDIQNVPLYTTRSKRAGEEEGKPYYFRTEAGYLAMEVSGLVAECRTYQKVSGPVRYFTCLGGIDLSTHDYFLSGTLVSYLKVWDVLGESHVVPVYIYVPEQDLLTRAIHRESRQPFPDCQEVCRRFLADSMDFSEEALAKAGIREENRFLNQDLDACVEAVAGCIRQVRG